MTDAETVLEWLGWPRLECLLPHPDGVTFDEVDPRTGNSGFAFRLDANWVHGTLIPALEERLGLYIFSRTKGGGITLMCKDKMKALYYDGTGPTFEAAFLAAAAKAVSDA